MRIVAVSMLLLFAGACGDSPSPPPAPVALAVSPGSEVLFAGDTFTFLAQAVREDGTRAPAPQGLTWTTADPQVATVDAATGRVTAVSNGTTLLVASAGGAIPQGASVHVQPDVFQKCERHLIAVGSVASGQLATGDCAMSHGTLYDVWEFRLSEPRSITIIMSSTAVQPYFSLWNRVGTVNATPLGAVNGEPGLARLTLPLQPGRYALLTYTSSTLKTGAYTVSIN